jgi:hypothetical protein
MEMKNAVSAKFKVGQVVSLAKVKFYQSGKRKAEQYQRITHIEPWAVGKLGGLCLTFVNGDRCHEKWVRKLAAKETGE